MIKNCKYCSREFEVNHKLRKYCDIKCQQTACREVVYTRVREGARLKKLNNMLYRNCKYCNIEFATTDKRKIYCDIKCGTKRNYARNKERIYARSKEQAKLKKLNNMLYKSCKHCNKEFQTALELKKYCDMTCQVQAKETRMYARKREATRLKKLNKLYIKNNFLYKFYNTK